MTVTVLYFAAVRDLVGLDAEPIELGDARTIGELSALLERRHAALSGRLGAVRFARNEAFAREEEPLAEGDVVAVIPPVSGG